MDDYVDEVIQSWREVRPDLDTDSIAVISRIMRAAQHIQLHLDALVASDVRLSHKGDVDTLTALRRVGPDNALTPSELARVGQLTSGGMTNRLDRLESAGLIARSPHPDDRRAVLVSLTAEGASLADDSFAAGLEAQDALLAPLSHTKRQDLADSLKALLLTLGDTPLKPQQR